MASARLNHDARLPVDVINDMLYQGGGGGRCTFGCQAAFNDTLAVAATPAPPIKHAGAASSRRHDPTLFRTTFKSPLQLDLKIESASKNVAGLGPYAPPSSHDFRPVDGENVDKDDFRAKFTLPSNQDLRRQIAQDQEGYLKGASLKNVMCDRYDPSQDGKPDFRLQLPHTSTKTGNLNLRLQVTLDQAGLFHGGQSIRDHRFRRDDDDPPVHNHRTYTALTPPCVQVDAPRFELEFKPTGKGYGCVDMGSKRRPDSIT
ncbi:hypothetical protein H310_02117 [Aphanomyces invadans]|uniref:Uncharacterized protein n=1 Tax=Aphanomyces invadans TaxID=157072 RepID=A0A024UMW6_9STRA|nr:hypothetical protein H310_02117 [Aphanomyces invadans]ETW07654.1 hypothetical protein H310_02117 [Aphanomyces invadans]|eukprot:XP_008863747.1 hypothetical protein H310_02117 [Aphanomyces invadans]